MNMITLLATYLNVDKALVSKVRNIKTAKYIPRIKSKATKMLPLWFIKICFERVFQGSDPLLQTARGKLQSQRSRLNDQINREIRLRAGAENLYK